MNRKVKQVSRFLFPCLLVTVLTVPADARQKSKTTVVGYSFAQADPDSEYGQSFARQLSTGTQIYVRAELNGKTILKVKVDEDKPVAIRDSTGKELPLSGADMSFMSDISEDKSSITLPIGSEELPATDAVSISVVGEVVLVCGADSTEEEVDVELKEDATFSVAGIDFKVNGVGESYQEGMETFELETKKSMSQIKSIQGVTTDGETVDMSSSGNSEWGFGDDMTYQRGYDVPGKVSDIRKLKVTYFKNLEEVKVPFDLKFGMGLQDNE